MMLIHKTASRILFFLDILYHFSPHLPYLNLLEGIIFAICRVGNKSREKRSKECLSFSDFFSRSLVPGNKSTSMKKVFNQLSNITLIANHDGYRFTKALSKKQKEMLEKFDASDDKIKSINENMSTLKN
jgi:hypothetical protein